ncbi:MAG: hypothetical protein RR744_06895, partial [Cellulosilyticaceae bacterium]
MKKVWKISRYILLVLVVFSTIIALFIGDITDIIKGVICVAFSTSLVLPDKLGDKNKGVQLTFWLSSILLL